MRRHAFDPISLVTGLVFLAIAVTYLVAAATGAHVSAGWVLPLGLIGLGLAGLAGSLRRGLRGQRDDEPVAQPVGVAAAVPVEEAGEGPAEAMQPGEHELS
jgi:H+/Cl- antiporter ClcA